MANLHEARFIIPRNVSLEQRDDIITNGIDSYLVLNPSVSATVANISSAIRSQVVHLCEQGVNDASIGTHSLFGTVSIAGHTIRVFVAIQSP